MSALGHKRTFALQKAMSALLLKADVCGANRQVCFGPKADMSKKERPPRGLSKVDRSELAALSSSPS
jgi:hypothetical protein